MKRQFSKLNGKLIIGFAAILLMTIGNVQSVFASSNNDCPAVSYSVCVDTTTPYGPIVQILGSSPYATVWSTGASACTTGDMTVSGGKYDGVTWVDIYSSGYDTLYQLGSGTPGCSGAVRGNVYFSQTQMDYFRWYVNSYGIATAYLR